MIQRTMGSGCCEGGSFGGYVLPWGQIFSTFADEFLAFSFKGFKGRLLMVQRA
jgi:hypothetical protein